MTPVSTVLAPCSVAVSPSSGSAVLSYLVVTGPSGSVGLPYTGGWTRSLSEAVKIKKQLQSNLKNSKSSGLEVLLQIISSSNYI